MNRLYQILTFSFWLLASIQLLIASLLFQMACQLSALVNWVFVAINDHFETAAESAFSKPSTGPRHGLTTGISTTSTIETVGGVLEYRFVGQMNGQLVVLVNSSTSTIDSLYPLASSLIPLLNNSPSASAGGSKFKALLFNYIPHPKENVGGVFGESIGSKPPHASDFGGLTDLVEYLNIYKPFTLVGFGSTGCRHSLDFTAESPELISRLVLFSPGLFSPFQYYSTRSGKVQSSLHTGLFTNLESLPGYCLYSILKGLSRFLRVVLRGGTAYNWIMDRVIVQSVYTLVLTTSLVIPKIRRRVVHPLTSDSKTGMVKPLIKSIPYTSAILETADQQLYIYSIFCHHLSQHLFSHRSILSRSISFDSQPYSPPTDKVFDRVSIHPRKILLLWGSRDSVAPVSHHSIYLKRLPQIQFELVDGATHFVGPIEHATDIAQAIARFMLK